MVLLAIQKKNALHGFPPRFKKSLGPKVYAQANNVSSSAISGDTISYVHSMSAKHCQRLIQFLQAQMNKAAIPKVGTLVNSVIVMSFSTLNSHINIYLTLGSLTQKLHHTFVVILPYFISKHLVFNKFVNLPNCNQVNVSVIGSVNLNDLLILHDVLL